MREFSRKNPGTHFFEQGEVGVEHALLPEMGAILPGMLVIGADSHTCTYGALGAFSTGVGSTDLAGFYLTGKAWLRVPPAIKVVFTGALRPWVTGKDLILALIGKISGLRGHLRGDRVLRACNRGPYGRGTAHHGEHGNRGRREKRHLRR